MTPFLYRIGRLAVQHRLKVIFAWLAVAIGLAIWVSALGGTQVTDNVTLPGTGSQHARDVLQHGFGAAGANGSNPIVFRAPPGSTLLSNARARTAVTRVAAQFAHSPLVLGVVSPFTPAGSAQLSRDRRIGYLSLSLRPGATELTHDQATALFAIAQQARAAGVQVAAGGYLGQELSSSSSANSEAIGLLAAIVVLLLTFGTVVAMGMPLLTAVFGLATGLSIIALLSQVTQVPSSAPALATMVGLGVGIDYSLFIVTRHRTQLHEGMELRESIARSVATSGGAVVFAGATVTIALCSLTLSGIPIVAQMGYLSAVVVVVAVLAAITLLPATLALAGRRIDALRVPGLRLHHDQHPSAWLRWARFVVRRPWPAVIVALALIAVLAAPASFASVRAERQRPASARHDGAAGIRPPEPGLRTRVQRPVADRRLGDPVRPGRGGRRAPARSRAVRRARGRRCQPAAGLEGPHRGRALGHAGHQPIGRRDRVVGPPPA